jgi:succinate dehydrogenase flavin-adding protein (antitoxin of CptAB toxin-antitoxin module)
MSSFPPCIRDADGDSESIRTIVAKVEAQSVAIGSWLSASVEAGRDAQAAAFIQLERDTDTNIFYVVLTLSKPTTSQHANRFRKKLEAWPMNAKVEWIRPFDRRLQRLFEWGDAWVESAVVEKAVEREDKCELLRYFPALERSIKCGDIERLPLMLGNQASGLLQIEDASMSQSDRLGLMRLQHELSASHVFGEPSSKWECTVCNEFGAARCACGAQRCSRHQCTKSAPRHRTIWKESVWTPGPFYVQNPKWMKKELKAEFIRDELGDGASLDEFALVYVDLFADKIRDEARRSICLDLYRIYDPSFKPKKECELSPAQLHQFQRVFDSQAKSRCGWCNTAMEQQQEYCSQACAKAANPPQKCQKCGSEDFKILHCPRGTQGARCAALNGMSRCRGCGHTEFCEVVGGNRPPKRKGAAVPTHWTKRRRS